MNVQCVPAAFLGTDRRPGIGPGRPRPGPWWNGDVNGAPERPQHTTFAASGVVVGSVLVALGAYHTIGDLRSLPSRENWADQLSRPPYQALDVSLESWLGFLQTTAVVAGVSAAACAVLGIAVFSRDRWARLGLTVTAVPLLAAGAVIDIFAAAFTTVCVVLLWLQPSRSWFSSASGATTVPLHHPGPPTSSPSQSPPPPPRPADPPFFVAPRQPSTRPRAVVWACVLTWSTCGFMFAVLVLSAVTLVMNPGMLTSKALSEQGWEGAVLSEESGVPQLSQQTLIWVAVTVSIGLAMWCLVAIVLGVLVYRGVEWSRVALIVSAAAAGTGLLPIALTQPVYVLMAGSAAATVWFLTRPETSHWLRHD